MFLDRDFDKNDNRRRLLRIHELGHALGLMHVLFAEGLHEGWEQKRNLATGIATPPTGATMN